MQIKEIQTSDTACLMEAARLVSEYSWGVSYPVLPIDEIKQAQYRVGAFQGDLLVAFGTVGRGFSPDTLDNQELWLAHGVVIPEFRKQGLFAVIYEKQLDYAISQYGRILSCTDNPLIEQFILKRGWKKLRTTQDESGGSSIVYEFRR